MTTLTPDLNVLSPEKLQWLAQRLAQKKSDAGT